MLKCFYYSVVIVHINNLNIQSIKLKCRKFVMCYIFLLNEAFLSQNCKEKLPDSNLSYFSFSLFI